MKSVKKYILNLIALFSLLLYCSFTNTFGQQTKKLEIRIIKLENPAYRTKIDKIISEENDITVAYNKIRDYFNPNQSSGDAFILKCNTCEGDIKYMKFPSRFPPVKKGKVLAGKGQDIVFIKDLSKLLSDSLAIIDSAIFDLREFIDNGKIMPFDIRIEFTFNGRLMRRAISYDSSNNALFFSQHSLFGQLPQEIIDTLSITAFFYDVSGKKNKLSSDYFKPHFLSAEETEDLRSYVVDLKKEFPGITTNEIKTQIEWLISMKYKKIMSENIEAWLKKQQL